MKTCGVCGGTVESGLVCHSGCINQLKEVNDRLVCENVQLKVQLAAKESINRLYQASVSLMEQDKAEAIHRMEKAEAALAESQRRERAAEELIRELRSDDSGDWGYIMFMIDKWMKQYGYVAGEEEEKTRS